jgi:hypothetical protein
MKGILRLTEQEKFIIEIEDGKSYDLILRDYKGAAEYVGKEIEFHISEQVHHYNQPRECPHFIQPDIHKWAVLDK